MPMFSEFSIANLKTCDERLQRVFNDVIKLVDCRVLEGTRSEQRQNFLFDTGMSKLRWPDGKHNRVPSLAADVAPYPIDWNNLPRFAMLAGLVIGIGWGMGIPIRAGIDWDGNFYPLENWIDAEHFEIIGD